MKPLVLDSFIITCNKPSFPEAYHIIQVSYILCLSTGYFYPILLLGLYDIPSVKVVYFYSMFYSFRILYYYIVFLLIIKSKRYQIYFWVRENILLNCLFHRNRITIQVLE